MLYARECLDAMNMMPMLHGLQFGGKYQFEFHDVWHDADAAQIKAKYQTLLQATGKPDAVPIFIDEEKQEALFAPNFEKFIAWVEGPDWWKK